MLGRFKRAFGKGDAAERAGSHAQGGAQGGDDDYEEGDYEEGDYEEGDYEEGDYEEGEGGGSDTYEQQRSAPPGHGDVHGGSPSAGGEAAASAWGTRKLDFETSLLSGVCP